MARLTSPLRQRNFRLLWVGESVSVVGDRVFLVALAISVLDSGGGATGLGIVLAARAVAQTILILPAGVLADRLGRAQVMIAADLLCMGAVIGFAVGPTAVPVAAVLAAAVGVGEGLFIPAFNAIIPQVLPADKTQQGNALVSVSFQGATVIGPAIGGVLVGLASVRAAFWIDAASFAVSLACLLAVRMQRQPKPVGQLSIAEAVGGFREVGRRPWVCAVMVMSAIQMLVASAAWTLLLPIVSRTHLHGTASYAALLALFGAGSVAGAFVAGRWHPAKPGLAALIALYPFGVMLTALALSDSVVVIGICAVAAGAGLQFFGIIWMTALQRDIPQASLARVMSLDYFVSGVLYPLGLAAMGPLAAHLGPSPILLFGAATLAATAFVPILIPGGQTFATPPTTPGQLDSASADLTQS